MKTELMNRKAALVAEMRATLDTAVDGKLSAEANAKLDVLNADLDAVNAAVEREAAFEAASASVIVTPSSTPVEDAMMAYDDAFRAYASRGLAGVDHKVLASLNTQSDPEGGYLVPEEFHSTLIKLLHEQNVMRGLATVISTGNTRNIPLEASTPDSTWTGEGQAYTESNAQFTQVVLGAHKLTTLTKVSEELLQDSAFNLNSYLPQVMAESMGRAEEAAFINGTGTNQPKGVAKAASDGGSYSLATGLDMDNLMDLIYNVSRVYRDRGSFLISDAVAKEIRKVKDGNGNYVWQPSAVAGQPDMLLGYRVVVTSNLPAPAAGKKPILFGDFSQYYIADRAGTYIQRLVELFAGNGQVGFRGFRRMDGQLVRADAIKFLKSAA